MRLFILALLPLFLMGCPGIRVVKNPDAKDRGIRYYRPKPYLLVTPASSTVEVPQGEKPPVKTTTPSDSLVNIELEYLPDFSEEYSVHVRTGWGIANVKMKLDDGWKLTELNQDLDSNVDDNIKAVAELTKALGGAFTPSSGGIGKAGDASTTTKKWTVTATNVPIGYYEAIIGQDANCNKRHHGWRYVGFAPYSSCPTDIYGSYGVDCQDPHAAIYGLVFEQGVMVFKDLTSASLRDSTPVAVPTGIETVVSSPKNLASELKKSVEEISSVKILGEGVEQASVLIGESSVRVTIAIHDSFKDDEAKKRAVSAITNANSSASQLLKGYNLSITAEDITFVDY